MVYVGSLTRSFFVPLYLPTACKKNPRPCGRGSWVCWLSASDVEIGLRLHGLFRCGLARGLEVVEDALGVVAAVRGFNGGPHHDVAFVVRERLDRKAEAVLDPTRGSHADAASAWTAVVAVLQGDGGRDGTVETDGHGIPFKEAVKCDSPEQHVRVSKAKARTCWVGECVRLVLWESD